MTRNLETRLQKLEAAVAPSMFRLAHRIIGYSIAECEAAAAELIASGRADPADRYVHRLVVSV